MNSFSPLPPLYGSIPLDAPSTLAHIEWLPVNPTLTDQSVLPSLVNVATRVPVSPGSILILDFDRVNSHSFNSGTLRSNSSTSDALPLGFWSLETTPSISQQYLSLALPSGTSKVTVTHSEDSLSSCT